MAVNSDYCYRMCILGLLFLVLPLQTKGAENIAPPSAELWQYILEFSDAQGELMDPETLATVEHTNANELENFSNSAVPVDDIHERKPGDSKAATHADEVQP